MNNVDMINMMLDYFLNNYIIAFVMGLLGSVIKDVLDHMSSSEKLNLKKIFISTIFSSFLSASLMDWLKTKFAFSVIILICLLMGMWGFWMLKWVTRYSNIYNLLINILKKVGTGVASGVAESLEETKAQNIKDNSEDDDPEYEETKPKTNNKTEKNKKHHKDENVDDDTED